MPSRWHVKVRARPSFTIVRNDHVTLYQVERIVPYVAKILSPVPTLAFPLTGPRPCTPCARDFSAFGSYRLLLALRSACSWCSCISNPPRRRWGARKRWWRAPAT